jgi:hypothetical protein
LASAESRPTSSENPGVANNAAEAALIARSARAARGMLAEHSSRGLSMHALSVQLSSKRLYIADLAMRLEAMENGKTRTSATAYRLFTRRMKAAMAGYPPGLLAAQLGRVHPSVLHEIVQQQFESRGILPGPGGSRARAAATKLLGRLRLPAP